MISSTSSSWNSELHELKIPKPMTQAERREREQFTADAVRSFVREQDSK